MKKLIIALAIFLGLVSALKKANIFAFHMDESKSEENIDEKDQNQESRKSLEFLFVPKKNASLSDETVYDDVMSRQSRPFGDRAGRSTNVHETVHGIHSDLRNQYQKNTKKKCNVFYCLKGRAVLVENPNITISTIKKYIPASLQSYRYKLYFTEQLRDWDDVPTYVMDEWVAYISGGECAVEDHRSGLNKEDSDAVSGCLDFSIYTVAFAMAVKTEDPEYWHSHPEFMEFIKFNMERAERAFVEGRGTFKSSKQEALLESLLNNDDAEEIRNFFKEELDGRFVSAKVKEAPVAFVSKCGRAEFRNEFELEAGFKKVVDYVDNNKRRLTDEMNIRIVEDMGGGKVKLSRKTRRGDFTWVAREEISRGEKSLKYKCWLDQAEDSGDIREMNVEVLVEDKGNSCKISVEMSIDVDGVGQKELKVDCNGRYRRIRELLKNELEVSQAADRAIDAPIRVLILKHSREKMADDDAKMVESAIKKASEQMLDVASIGNHFINETKKIRVSLKEWSEIENLKEFMSDQIRNNKTPDSTLILFTVGHGSPSGGLHNLGKREEMQKAIAEAAEENDQRILWWQLSCYAEAKLPPIDSLSDRQKELVSVLNTSDERTPSPAYIEGKIMEQMFASMSSGEMDADGNEEISGLEFEQKMNNIKKGRGNLFRMYDRHAPLFGISFANRLPIFESRSGKLEINHKFIPMPRGK